jgi:hypothetical protein
MREALLALAWPHISRTLLLGLSGRAGRSHLE